MERTARIRLLVGSDVVSAVWQLGLALVAAPNAPAPLALVSAALGATTSQTVGRVLLPAALPQLTTGIVLAAGKMIGETAAIIFTVGSSSPYTGWFSLNPLRAPVTSRCG